MNKTAGYLKHLFHLADEIFKEDLLELAESEHRLISTCDFLSRQDPKKAVFFLNIALDRILGVMLEKMEYTSRGFQHKKSNSIKRDKKLFKQASEDCSSLSQMIKGMEVEKKSWGHLLSSGSLQFKEAKMKTSLCPLMRTSQDNRRALLRNCLHDYVAFFEDLQERLEVASLFFDVASDTILNTVPYHKRNPTKAVASECAKRVSVLSVDTFGKPNPGMSVELVTVFLDLPDELLDVNSVGVAVNREIKNRSSLPS